MIQLGIKAVAIGALVGASYKLTTGQQADLNAKAALERIKEVREQRRQKINELTQLDREGRSSLALSSLQGLPAKDIDARFEDFDTLQASWDTDAAARKEQLRQEMGRQWYKRLTLDVPNKPRRPKDQKMNESERARLDPEVQSRKQADRLKLLKEWNGDFDHSKDTEASWPV